MFRLHLLIESRENWIFLGDIETHVFSREVASALERSFFALQAVSKGLCGSIALHWPFVTEKILQTLLFILRVGCMEHLVGHSCTKQAYSLHTNTHPWGFWLSGPNALLGVEIWVREMWKWLSLSSFETLHLSLTAVSGGCAFTQAGDLCRSSQKKVTRAKESRQPPLPPGGQGFHPPHHPQVSSSRFSSAFSWAAFLFRSPPFCSSAHLLPLQRFPRLLGLLLVCSGWTLLFAFRRARTLSAPFLLFYRAVQTAQSHRMAHVPEDMLWQRRPARTAKSKNPLQEWARTKSLKNSTGRIDAENTDSKLDMGSVVFACASAVTATALSEVNNCLVRNSPYSKAEHIPGQNSSKLLMIALTGLELQLAQLLFFPLRTCLNFAHDPLSKARGVQPTQVETCWLFFLVMCFFHSASPWYSDSDENCFLACRRPPLVYIQNPLSSLFLCRSLKLSGVLLFQNLLLVIW